MVGIFGWLVAVVLFVCSFVCFFSLSFEGLNSASLLQSGLLFFSDKTVVHRMTYRNVDSLLLLFI